MYVVKFNKSGGERKIATPEDRSFQITTWIELIEQSLPPKHIELKTRSLEIGRLQIQVRDYYWKSSF